MGFDLSEFYEIYGHDLEVEARQEQQRFQQRLLGWVQTWSNTLCSLYDTAVNRVRALAPEDWPLADLVPQVVLYWSLAGAQEGNQWNRTLACGDGEMVSRQYSKPYPPLLYTLMAHRAFPATFDAAAQSIVQGGAPLFYREGALRNGVCGTFWQKLVPHLPPYRPYQMWPQPLETLLRTLTQCYGIFSGQDTTAVYEDARKTFQALWSTLSLRQPDRARAEDAIRRWDFSQVENAPRDLLIAAYPEVFQTWDKETLENTWEAEILQRIYPADPDLAIAMWRLLLDTAQEPLQKNPEAAEYLLFDVIDDVLWPGSPSRKDHLLPLLNQLEQSEPFARQVFQSAYAGKPQARLLEACDTLQKDALKKHCLALLAENPAWAQSQNH